MPVGTVAQRRPLPSTDVLSQRALNRALLARQLLLRRRKLSAYETIERLVAMQAQVPNSPYVGLWTRLHGFRPNELSDLITGRRAVRLALLRSTIHLVTDRDCLRLRPLLQPYIERHFHTGTPFGRQIRGVDTNRLVTAARALLDEKPRTIAELGKLLQEQWPERDAMSLAYAIRELVALVHDNILLAHADRSRVMAVAYRPAIFPSLLVDGFVAATWKIIRQAGRATLVIDTFKPLKKSDREAVGEEGMRLLTLAASDVACHDIHFKRA